MINRIKILVKILPILFFMVLIFYCMEDSTAFNMNLGLSNQNYIPNPVTEVQHKNFMFPSADYQFPSGPHAFTHPDDFILMGIALILIVIMIRLIYHYYTKKRSKYLESSGTDYEATEEQYSADTDEITGSSMLDDAILQLRVVYSGDWEGSYTDFLSNSGEYREVRGHGNKVFKVNDFSKPNFEEVMIPKTLKKIFPKTADAIIESGKEVMFKAFFNITDGGNEVMKLEVIRDGEIVESANSKEDTIGGYEGSVALYYSGEDSKKSLREVFQEDVENSKMKQGKR